jgi:hypothetical protein
LAFQVVKEKKSSKTVPFETFLALAGYDVKDDEGAAAYRESRRIQGWATIQGHMLFENNLTDFSSIAFAP